MLQTLSFSGREGMIVVQNLSVKGKTIMSQKFILNYCSIGVLNFI